MSKIGLTVSGAYLLACLFFISANGLTGESFIALILGLPWSLGFAFFEYWSAKGALLVFLLLLPIALNAYILYWIGSLFHRTSKSTVLANSSDVSFVPTVMGDGGSHSHSNGNGDGGASAATSTDSSGGGGGDGGGS